MNPIFLTIGNYEIRYYSLFILLACILCFSLIDLEAKRFNIKSDFMFNMMFWAFISGIIGARLYYVVFNYSEFAGNFQSIFQVWNGGLAIHGGIIFGLIAIIVYCKKYKVRTIRMLDIITVPLLLAQAIGRWGNFFNQEAHGAATTVTMLQRLMIPDFIIKGMTIDGVTYMPTFLFESLACLIGFVVLCIVRRGKYVKVGNMTAGYLIIYGIIRFFIEISRTDALMLGGFKVAQIVSIIMIIIGIGILMYTSHKSKFEDLYNDKTNVDEIRF